MPDIVDLRAMLKTREVPFETALAFSVYWFFFLLLSVSPPSSRVSQGCGHACQFCRCKEFSLGRLKHFLSLENIMARNSSWANCLVLLSWIDFGPVRLSRSCDRYNMEWIQFIQTNDNLCTKPKRHKYK